MEVRDIHIRKPKDCRLHVLILQANSSPSSRPQAAQVMLKSAPSPGRDYLRGVLVASHKEEEEVEVGQAVLWMGSRSSIFTRPANLPMGAC
jgi:hypothetical protein